MNEAILKAKYAFSNHRKYQSLSAYSDVGTGAVVASYVSWVAPPRTHLQMIQELHKNVGQDPRVVFDSLYRSMDSVMGFGRLGKFDFLTMLGKVGLAPIEPGSAYLVGATGPLQGARLLFTNDAREKVSSRELDARLAKLDSYLDVGMQVLEDSLCNWQNSNAIHCPVADSEDPSRSKVQLKVAWRVSSSGKVTNHTDVIAARRRYLALGGVGRRHWDLNR